MKILFLLFCFTFVGCFSIFHLNIWWAFLWPHLVTSSLHLCGVPPSARNTLPSSFYSGLRQAWLTPAHILRILVCVTCPDSTALGYTPLRWALEGAVLTASIYCLCVSQFWGVLFSSLTSTWAPGGDRLCLSVRSPAQDLWLWMFVEWMFKPHLIDPECLKVWH